MGKRLKLNSQPFEKYLAILFVFAILISSVQAVRESRVIVTSKPSYIALSNPPEYLTLKWRPNIYFIVPDRMPSPDAMRESGINPDAFVQSMRDLGFYVKENQVSADPFTATSTDKNIKTTRTMRFFASVLNLGEDIPLDMPYKECRQLITYPKIADVLHANGYSFTNIASWFAETKKIDADFTYRYPSASLMEKAFDGELVEAFWERSIFRGMNLRVLQPQSMMNQIDRDRHIWQADTLKNVVPNSSQFVMAHILLPHEPFVWNSEGQPQADKSLTIPEQYIQQIKFTENYLMQLALDLRQVDPTAIIIFQADEGMAYKKPVELNYSLSPTQWSGVFTAWYIPGADEKVLHQLKHTEILKYILKK